MRLTVLLTRKYLQQVGEPGRALEKNWKLIPQVPLPLHLNSEFPHEPQKSATLHLMLIFNMSHTRQQLHASVSKPPSTELPQSDLLISSPSTPRSSFALVLSVHLSCHTLFHILISLRREKQHKDRASFTFACTETELVFRAWCLTDLSCLLQSNQNQNSHSSSSSLTFFETGDINDLLS